MKRIILVGSERSGTNLLRVLLGNHSSISAPAPVHLLDVFQGVARRSLDFSEAGLESLLKKTLDYVNCEFSDWRLPPSVLHDASHGQINSAIEVFDWFYTSKAEKEGREAYFCKDNNMHKYAPALTGTLDNVQLIYIYRDPRDQVASWMKNPLYLKTPYSAAIRWKTDQDVCLSLESFYGIPVFSIKYEDLISDTEQVMTQCLNYLDIEVEDSCFQTSGKNDEASRHALWRNLDKPILKNNSQKYKSVLKEKDIRLVEAVCAEHMHPLGYEFDTDAHYDIGNPYIWKIKELLRSKVVRTGDGLDMIIRKNRYVRSLFE